MISLRSILAIGLGASVIVGCASPSVVTSDIRTPAGTGDIDSSGLDSSDSVFSYKLPITRNGKKETRVAYPMWSGEYPAPPINVNAEQSGTTKIDAYKSLRTLDNADKTTCTIKNGLYHPWADPSPASIINYYTVVAAKDYKVIRKITYSEYSEKAKKDVKKVIPKGATITNVIYHGEGYCGAILKIGKNPRAFTNDCSFFTENKDLQQISPPSDFSEQWLYLTCEEKDSNGKNEKAFVQDKALLAQPGIKEGCIVEYGTVGVDGEACRGN